LAIKCISHGPNSASPRTYARPLRTSQPTNNPYDPQLRLH
jgi:hypothetical protein